jgi:hypothetical protein
MGSSAQMDAGKVRGKVDFGILTIREDEFTAVLDSFPDQVGTLSGKWRYRIRRVPLANGEAYTLAVLRCAEQGNTDALMAARDMRSAWSGRP